MEFPDDDLIKILKQYGELKEPARLRRLYFDEDEYRHIERGVRVAEFTKIARDSPCRIVVPGLEIGFKYSGQPATCYRCQSTEHVVKNCPKRGPNRPGLVGVLPAPPTPVPENPDNDAAESQMDVSASEEPNPSQSQPLLDTPSQATPSYAGAVQAEPTLPPPSFAPIQ